jgi:UDP-GlcNAc:undecaprenyl-phosphate/decaprenyl-phosphate GlcNAc-1-phosphate transferase
MAIVVTAIGIALLLITTVWLRLRAIVNSPDSPIPHHPDDNP